MKKYEFTVIVLGLDLNGLTAVRALGRKGIPVWGISFDKQSLGLFSKYLSNSFIVSLDKTSLKNKLLEISSRFQSHKPLLFPSTDETVKFLAENYKDLCEYYTIGFDSPELIKKLINKASFRSLAMEKGLNVSIAQVLTKGNVILSDKIKLPVIVKTPEKINKNGINLPKAVIVKKQKNLKRWISNYLKYTDQCLVEEYIRGEDNDVYFVFVLFNQKGHLVVSYPGRKIRQWPVNSGGTASAEYFDCPELVQKTVDFFEKVKFTGIGSMEYKYDHNKKEYIAIEPTVGRLDFQEGLAIGNGINFAFEYYKELYGISLKTIVVPKRFRNWVCFDSDYNAVSFLYKSKGFIARWFLWFIFKPKIYSLFCLKDLRPFFIWFKRRFFYES